MITPFVYIIRQCPGLRLVLFSLARKQSRQHALQRQVTFGDIAPFVNTTNTNLDIIQYPNFIHNTVSETGFCLHLEVEPTQLGQIDRANLCLRTRATTLIEYIKPIQ
jgi:hypothetical protein